MSKIKNNIDTQVIEILNNLDTMGERNPLRRVYNKNELDQIININTTVFEIEKYFKERIDKYNIIYNYEAMQYLSEYDHSLQESIDIAYNRGVNFEDITSTLLATLLVREDMHQELYHFMWEFFL